jgi:hypothetical protein
MKVVNFEKQLHSICSHFVVYSPKSTQKYTMLPLEIVLPQKNNVNANDISALINLFSDDLNSCKKDLYPLRRKPYWEKMFSGLTLKNADILVHANDGIDLFLGVLRSIFYQHADQNLKFTELREKLIQHMLIVTSVGSDVERYGKSKNGIDNTYTPIAAEFLERYRTVCTGLKKQVDLLGESDDPTFSVENMIREDLFSALEEITKDISERLHAQLSIDDIMPDSMASEKPKLGKQNPLKHPNFNQEIVDLIQKSREDALKEVKKLEAKVADQAKAIKVLRNMKKEGGDVGTVKTMAMFGLGIGIIALLLAIAGMVI